MRTNTSYALLTAAMLIGGIAEGRAQTFEEVLGYGLPVIVVETTDGEDPTSEAINPPPGCVGRSITNIVPKYGRVQMYRGDTLWYDSGEYVEGKSGMKIRHRGNVSAAFTKNKPYKLKLQKKADLIEKRYDAGDTRDMRSKNWVLLNYSYSVETPLAFQLSSLVGLEYTPRVEFVNVMFNGDFRGMYILSESISRENSCRITVDKQDGYIIELDPYFWNEDYYIKSRLCSFLHWTLKYPDPEDLTPEQEANIRSDIDRFELSLTGSDYPQVMDVRSFVRFIMLHDIMSTRDGAGCNVYIARTDRSTSSLMRMFAIWDMTSSSMLHPEEWSVTHTYPGIRLFPSLFENELCPEFTRVYIEEWKRIREEHVIDSLNAWADWWGTTQEVAGIRGSAPHNMERWGLSYGLNHVDGQLRTAKNWMVNREKWMDEQIAAMKDFYDGVPAVPESQTDSHPTARKVILDGHLYIVRDGKTYSPDGKRME